MPRKISAVTNITVRVRTGARKESVAEVSKGRFEVSVREKPEQNLANERVRELVAIHFRVPKTRVRIVKGHHRPSKLISVETF